jgi:hypothetical protein
MSDDASKGVMLIIILMAVGVLVYFTPWFVANKRNHPNRRSIGFLNLLLGWTFIGWVVALVWAYSNFQSAAANGVVLNKPLPGANGGIAPGLQQPEPNQKTPVADNIRPCPFCAEDVKLEAIKCKHCGSMLDAVAAAAPPPTDKGDNSSP